CQFECPTTCCLLTSRRSLAISACSSWYCCSHPFRSAARSTKYSLYLPVNRVTPIPLVPPSLLTAPTTACGIGDGSRSSKDVIASSRKARSWLATSKGPRHSFRTLTRKDV